MKEKHLAMADKFGNPFGKKRLKKMAKAVHDKLVESKRNREMKCTLCSETVLYKDRRKHLKRCHQMFSIKRLADYFVFKPKSKTADKRWYNPDSKPISETTCGRVLNGPPPAKIIYNAFETGRRKH